MCVCMYVYTCIYVYIYNFTYLFFLTVLSLPCCASFSLVVANRDYSPRVACRLPLRGFSCCRAQWLQHVGSVVEAPRLQSTGLIIVVNGLSCSTACGIFQDQRPNPCLLHWQADSLPLSHQGSP